MASVSAVWTRPQRSGARRGVRAYRNPGSDTVRIEMMVMSEGANHRPVEQLTSRLSLEPSVTSAAWEATGEEANS